MGAKQLERCLAPTRQEHAPGSSAMPGARILRPAFHPRAAPPAHRRRAPGCVLTPNGVYINFRPSIPRTKYLTTIRESFADPCRVPPNARDNQFFETLLPDSPPNQEFRFYCRTVTSRKSEKGKVLLPLEKFRSKHFLCFFFFFFLLLKTLLQSRKDIQSSFHFQA